MRQGAKTRIKHTLLIILGLHLILGLSDDGNLSKATIDLLHASTRTSVSTPHCNGSGHVVFRHEIEPAYVWAPPSQASYQLVPLRVQPTLEKIAYRNSGSSGGIPH
jgi:hypothetical protein